jgi:hypothetical protein
MPASAAGHSGRARQYQSFHRRPVPRYLSDRRRSRAQAFAGQRAAIRLGEQAETLCPGLQWHDIRGVGNWLRHKCDYVDLDTIWRTVTDDLTPLAAAVRLALSTRLRKS